MEIIEHTYKSNLPIKYVFSEGKSNKDYLVVVFSAFSPEKAEIKHSYNYIRSLQHIDCHRLYILDNYGPRGCYYLGANMDFEVETCVNSLISFFTRKYMISQNNVITVGSSKGGSAALYFGLKYHYGHIIAGAPQTKVADYVLNSAKDTSAYIFGESHPSRESIQKLDRIIFEQLDKEIVSELHLLSSENDSQFNVHIKPFLDLLDQKGIKGHVQINNEIKNHSQIAKHFPYFLQKVLYQLFGLDFKKSVIFSRDYLQKTYEYSIANNHICFKLDCHQLQDVEYAFYIILDNQVIEKVMYQDDPELVFPITLHGSYRIHYFVRSKQNGEKISNKTHEIEFTPTLVNSGLKLIEREGSI